MLLFCLCVLRPLNYLLNWPGCEFIVLCAYRGRRWVGLPTSRVRARARRITSTDRCPRDSNPGPLDPKSSILPLSMGSTWEHGNNNLWPFVGRRRKRSTKHRTLLSVAGWPPSARVIINTQYNTSYRRIFALGNKEYSESVIDRNQYPMSYRTLAIEFRFRQRFCGFMSFANLYFSKEEQASSLQGRYDGHINQQTRKLIQVRT